MMPTMASHPGRPPRPRARRHLPALAAAVVLLGATATGCGGDGDAATTTQAPSTADEAGDDGSTTSAPADDQPDQALVIAHRGASGSAPEHTLAAYDLALEQGADHIEQDLQLTSDGVLVVLHDDTLDRTARGPAASCTGPVAEKTLAQVQECEVGSWFNEANPDQADPAFAGERIPTLEEVLDRYGPDERYYIEIKAGDQQAAMVEGLLELLDEAGLGSPEDGSRQVLVQSFSAETLRDLHAQRPDLPLVQLTPAGAALDGAGLDDIATYAVGVGPPETGVDAALVEAAHERCLDVHPYTVDEPERMGELLDLGVDGMFTNSPDALVEQRDQHPAPPEHCTGS